MSRRLFQLLPEDSDSSTPGLHVEGRHRWGVPGVECKSCGETWAQTGIAYPTVCLEGFDFEKLLAKPGVVSMETMRRITDALDRLLAPRRFKAVAGMELGPLELRVSGKQQSFGWVNPWTFVALERSLQELQALEVLLPNSARCDVRGTGDLSLRELELDAGALLTSDSFVLDSLRVCDVCGRNAGTLATPVVAEESIRGDADVFRAENCPTLILAEARFVDAAREINQSGMAFREVSVR